MTQDQKQELKGALAELDKCMKAAAGSRAFAPILALRDIVALLASMAMDDLPDSRRHTRKGLK
jgi:hypothetical protein